MVAILQILAVVVQLPLERQQGYLYASDEETVMVVEATTYP